MSRERTQKTQLQKGFKDLLLSTATLSAHPSQENRSNAQRAHLNFISILIRWDTTERLPLLFLMDGEVLNFPSHSPSLSTIP